MEAAGNFYRLALGLARETDDPAAIGNALYNLVFPHALMGDRAEGDRLLDQALSLYREVGNGHGVGRVLWGIASVAQVFHDSASAVAPFEESLAVFEELGDAFNAGWAHRMLGRALFDLGDQAGARRHLQEGLQIFANSKDQSAVVLYLADFARLAVGEGFPERAIRLVGAKSRLEETSGTGLAVAVLFNEFPGLPELVAQLGEEKAAALLEEGRGHELRPGGDLCPGEREGFQRFVARPAPSEVAPVDDDSVDG
ncbi:MAG: tetratricopeptide repeat protein [Acidimicrobiia bacterium]